MPMSHEARELEVFAETSSEPVYRMFTAVEENLAKKMAKGKYDSKKAVKAFKHVADFAAQQYTKEFGAPGPHGSYGLFSAADRREVARSMRDRFEARVKTGEVKVPQVKRKKAAKRKASRKKNGNPHNSKSVLKDALRRDR